MLSHSSCPRLSARNAYGDPMDDTDAATIGTPLRLTDDSTLCVETCDGLVRLVIYDRDGDFVRGIMLAPSDAQRLGQNLATAAFTAHESEPDA